MGKSPDLHVINVQPNMTGKGIDLGVGENLKINYCEFT